MKTKKVLSVLLAAGLVAGLTSGAALTVSAEEKDTYEVAFLPTDMSHTFASWLAAELETAFDAYDDMNLTIMDNKNDLQTQLGNLETCVSQGYDYIILLPLEPAAEDDIVAEYIEAGTSTLMTFRLKKLPALSQIRMTLVL